MEKSVKDSYQEVHITVIDAPPVTKTSTINPRPHVSTEPQNLSTTSSNIFTTLPTLSATSSIISTSFRTFGNITREPPSRPGHMMWSGVGVVVMVMGMVLFYRQRRRCRRPTPPPIGSFTNNAPSGECFAAYNKEPTAAVSPQHQISTQGSRQTSGWTVQEHQTWKPDTATCSQQAGPCMPPHQPSQSQNQWREQDILLTPAKLAQCPSGPQEQYLQSSQRYVVPETHHGQPYGFPSPQQHPMPISYATHPSSFTTSQYYPQQYMAPPQPHPYQFRQTRPSRARQCFHCQRRKAEEPCTHCYRCGSNEHFLAGCKEGGSRVQHRVQLNGDGLPPRDRE
ncbi:hypothetical protein DPEC_G00169860 [Dallia pectoralis]|uniref:Uncharacterized protein n=1 Tax=Dallia pectoralis TaxID=75939 RepID=A0ACC2GCY1_DALPE|nr:hypothetical protein DPEC_G00169860 [Dallia pectoralis]